MNGIGYRQTVEWLRNNDNDTQNLINTISLASVQYAKRQRTRFRRYKKDSLENPKDRVFYMTITL